MFDLSHGGIQSKPKNRQTRGAVNMARADSGFEDGHGRRSSSTSSGRRPKHSPSASLSGNKRTRKYAPLSQVSPTRSDFKSHWRRPSSSQTSSVNTYEFFQFPTLAEPSAETGSRTQILQLDSDDTAEKSSPSRCPPCTVNYWTSVESRRLEYAAIDAASHGVRGFMTRLLPDCILPADYKRTKFHSEDKDDEDGSVRRYRLHLPEERSMKNDASLTENEKGYQMEWKRPGVWQRLSFGRSKTP